MSMYIQRPDGTALYFDLTEEEKHVGGADITDFPVEEGPDISDQYRPMYMPFTVKVFITNTPLVPSGNQDSSSIGPTVVNISPIRYVPPPLSTAAAVLTTISNPIGAITNALSTPGPTSANVTDVLQFSTEFDTNSDTQDVLDAIIENSELLTVYTSIATYEQVGLQHYELVRNAGTGTGSSIDLTFKPMQLVQLQTSAVPAATQINAKTTLNNGSQQNTPVSPANKESVAQAMNKAITSWVKH